MLGDGRDYLLSTSRLELQKRALLQVCRLGEKFSSLSRSTFLSSPRMPHTLGEIFTHAQYQISKTATAGPGADSVFVDHHVRSRARSSGQRLLQAAAETTACGADQLAKKT